MSGVLPASAEKPRFVADMFGRIAARYDLMNSLITLGRDRGWRRAVAHSLSGLGSSPVVLDVGTGTGRLAQAVLEGCPSARVVGVDFTPGMLRQAPPTVRPRLAAGDALRLPFADARFDAVVSGFLVRNLADVSAGIAEQVRVLTPGGLLVILETTPGPQGLLRLPYGLYFRGIVPLLGRLIAGDGSAYTYLPESTLAFVEPTRLAQILSERGLRDVRTRRLTLGTVAVTVGRKPPRGA